MSDGRADSRDTSLRVAPVPFAGVSQPSRNTASAVATADGLRDDLFRAPATGFGRHFPFFSPAVQFPGGIPSFSHLIYLYARVAHGFVFAVIFRKIGHAG